MRYIFKTTATMKVYNNNKWWIDSGVVREISVEANNTKEALEKYRKIVFEKYYIEISNNAIKDKKPMYSDTIDDGTKQVGYVLTGKAAFEDKDNDKYSSQYIDLWVKILTVVDTKF